MSSVGTNTTPGRTPDIACGVPCLLTSKAKLFQVGKGVIDQSACIPLYYSFAPCAGASVWAQTEKPYWRMQWNPDEDEEEVMQNCRRNHQQHKPSEEFED